MNATTAVEGSPRIYSITSGWRIFFVLAGALLIGIAGMVVWTTFVQSAGPYNSSQRGLNASVATAALALGLVLLGLYTVVSAISARLNLYADAIETEGPLSSKRRLRREDIAGMRRIPTSPPFIKLIPTAGRGKPISISHIYRWDQALNDWMKGIKDLDAADAQSNVEEMFRSGVLGSNREQGLQRLARAQKTTKILRFAGLGIGFWLFFYPHPLSVALAANALAPLIGLAIIVRSKGLYGIDQQRVNPRPSVASFVIIPSLSLAMYALRSYSIILDWTLLLQWSLGGAIAFSLVTFWIDPEVRKRPLKILPVILVMGLPYAYGIGAISNAGLDASAPRSYQTQVNEKLRITGKNPEWKLILGPWAGRPAGDEVRVTPSCWNSVYTGDMVTIELHQGALHVAWYRVIPNGANNRRMDTTLPPDSVAAVAKSEAAPLAPGKSLALLRQKKYDDLDRSLNDVQTAYAEHRLSDVALRNTFRAFYDTDPALEPLLNEWVSKYPSSYAARLARGIHYKYLGFQQRGERFISETSPAQIQGMQSYFEKATEDFQASLRLENRPTLTYMHLLNIGQQAGLKEWNRQLLDEAIRLDTDNFIVRLKYMYTLEPRWGGSVQAMAAFLEECRNAHLPQNELRELEAVVTADQAWAQGQQGDYRGSLQAYQAAIGKTGDNAEILEQQSYAHMKLKEYDKALPYLDRLIALEPNSAWGFASRGVCYMNLGRRDEAIDNYLKAARLGDPWAQNEMGKRYWYGADVAKNQDEAIKLFTRAANQGEADAQKNLWWALRQQETTTH